ncbi:hypothetical protein ACMD2_23135 [Ananas comosus]|uniref:Uncharacterized protein n=1 Tax=Ananas comosus TaxID=4615 RepID=A0A199VZV6_ANACO|nr:hypothetical protein ACMD2_23135 [Ananas comosus]
MEENLPCGKIIGNSYRFLFLVVRCVLARGISFITLSPLRFRSRSAAIFLLYKDSVLVAIQGALTVIGNMTMCIAAFRIFKASQEGSKSS